MKRLVVLLSCIVFSIAVHASPISDAVDTGKAKELPSGYVEAVDKSGEIVELVNKVNAGRKAEYERIAKENGLTTEQVGKASYEKRFPKK